MRVVAIENAAEPLLSPDIIWDDALQMGDLAISPLSDPVNPGGLVAQQAITTAVIICLQTDKRADLTELRDGDVNRGWPGDAFDMEPDDVPLGSKLWLLRRSALDEDIELRAADYAREAIQPLLDQGVAVRADVSATATRAGNRLDLDVGLYGRDGANLYQKRFAVLWDQVNGV